MEGGDGMKKEGTVGKGRGRKGSVVESKILKIDHGLMFTHSMLQTTDHRKVDNKTSLPHRFVVLWAQSH